MACLLSNKNGETNAPVRSPPGRHPMPGTTAAVAFSYFFADGSLETSRNETVKPSNW